MMLLSVVRDAIAALQAKRVVSYYWKEKQPLKYPDRPSVPPLVLYFPEYHAYSISSYEYPGLVKVAQKT